MEKYVHHALGHFNEDKRKKDLKIQHENTYFVDDTPGVDSFPIKGISRRLISEGIGVYFARKMISGVDNFKDSEWPKDIVDFSTLYRELDFNRELELRFYYDEGFHLVKPIIKMYQQIGIDYLLRNPPTARDLRDLLSYQKRILNKLSGSAKN